MSAFFREMLHVGIYKRSQGRVARQVTFAALAITIALGLIGLSAMLGGAGVHWQYGLPGVLLLAGLWVSYRVVNVPSFADFLIAVEAEMNKVSWPTWPELSRASVVVLVLIFTLAITLAVFDYAWAVLFRWLHIMG